MLMFRLVVAMLAAFVCNGCGGNTPGTLPQATLTIHSSHTTDQRDISAEIAATAGERQKGLMYRTTLGEDQGMLFIFPGNSEGGFWMKNTLIPLTIAYIGADGRIQELRDGVPLDDKTILTPAAPYRYVLEMNKGWFERHGFGVGDIIAIPAGLPVAH